MAGSVSTLQQHNNAAPLVCVRSPAGGSGHPFLPPPCMIAACLQNEFPLTPFPPIFNHPLWQFKEPLLPACTFNDRAPMLHLAASHGVGAWPCTACWHACNRPQPACCFERCSRAMRCYQVWHEVPADRSSIGGGRGGGSSALPTCGKLQRAMRLWHPASHQPFMHRHASQAAGRGAIATLLQNVQQQQLLGNLG